MSYRFEGLVHYKRKSWGYQIDYDKEIANDEREIAYLSSEVCKAFSAVVEERYLAGDPLAGQLQTASVLFYKPELYEVLGLTKDEARALFVALEAYADRIPALYGPVEDWRADWRLGDSVADRPGPNGIDPLHRWYVPRETGKRGRAELLKAAKRRLSSHKRNREKFGRE